MHELTRAALACVDAIDAHMRGLTQPSNWTGWAANAEALRTAADAFYAADSTELRIILAGVQPKRTPGGVVEHSLTGGSVYIEGEGGLPEMFGVRFPSHHHLAAGAARLLLTSGDQPSWLDRGRDALIELRTWLPPEIEREAAELEKRRAMSNADNGLAGNDAEASRSAPDADFGGLSLDARAVGLLVQNPRLSTVKIAKALGVDRRRLHDLPLFQAARKAQKVDQVPSHGHRGAPQGDGVLEAYDRKIPARSRNNKPLDGDD